MNLTKIDYELLEFISKNPNCTKQDILQKFKKEKAIEYRLNNLSENICDDFGRMIECTSYINHKCDRTYIDCGVYHEKYYDCYFLNPVGHKILSDQKNFILQEKINHFKYSFLYPILTSSITGIFVAYFTAKYITSN